MEGVFLRLKATLYVRPPCHDKGIANALSTATFLAMTALFLRLPPFCRAFLLCAFKCCRMTAACSVTYAITPLSMAQDTMLHCGGMERGQRGERQKSHRKVTGRDMRSCLSIIHPFLVGKSPQAEVAQNSGLKVCTIKKKLSELKMQRKLTVE